MCKKNGNFAHKLCIMRLLFASNNAHKLEEVRGILPAEYEVLSLNEVGFHAEIDETGETLEENSMIKATVISQWLRMHPEVQVDGVFADDTGLEIEALGGQPGVRTARWAGEDCLAANNRAKALRELQGVTNRAARFRTVVTLIRGEQPEQVDGIVSGAISTEERGDGGFGYDPVFIPEGYDCTFAELPAEVKNGISHRARAMQALRRLLTIVILFFSVAGLFAKDNLDYGSMGRWHLYPSFNSTSVVVDAEDQIYALSDGSLYAVDKQNRTCETWDKTTGLNGNKVSTIAYDAETHQLLVLYTDGLIDFIRNGEVVMSMADIYLKSQDMTIVINSITMDQGYAFLATSFGVIQLNLKRYEVVGTYYFGPSGSAMNVQHVVVMGGQIYAATATGVYRAAKHSILEDYANWKPLSMPGSGDVVAMASRGDDLYVVRGKSLWVYRAEQWLTVDQNRSYYWLRASEGHLLAGTGDATMKNYVLADYDEQGQVHLDTLTQYTLDAFYSDSLLWGACDLSGVVCLSEKAIRELKPSGPYHNNAFDLTFEARHLYVAAGGRWAAFLLRQPDVVKFDGTNWTFTSGNELRDSIQYMAFDLLKITVDPYDHTHYFASMYGYGVVEFKNDKPCILHSYERPGCTINSAVPDDPRYVFTFGSAFDPYGNYWVAVDQAVPAINMMTPDGKWYGMDLGTETFRTNAGLLVDNRHPNWKWVADARSFGVTLYDDGGTPTNTADDRHLLRKSFTDQKGANVSPTFLYCITQDKDGAIWVGTNTGLFVINHENFFSSDACHRPLIPRNDGSGLADYLLQTEQINAIAVDGSNRKWIGTEASGLYLVSPDGLETIAHFTDQNSELPSSTILSLAIDPESGTVYVGTANGIAAYKSDASMPADNFSNAYAYPNPVRSDYVGDIVISNLMDNTWVNIVDGGGNVVFRTRSNGGTAVWDGTNQHKERVGTGVYSALCTAGDGSGDTVVKILIMNR